MATEYQQPPRPNFRVKHIWAFIAVDPRDNSEGIMAFRGPSGGWEPMFAADKDRLKSLRPIARHQARQTGQRVKLVKFTLRKDEEFIDP